MIKRLLLYALVVSTPGLSHAQDSEPADDADMVPIDRSEPRENTISTAEDGTLRFTTVKYAEPASSEDWDAKDIVIIRHFPCGPAQWEAPDIPDWWQAEMDYHAERCEREKQQRAAARAEATAFANARAWANERASQQYERAAAVSASSANQPSTVAPRRRLVIGLADGGAIEPKTGQYYPGIGGGLVFDTREGKVVVPGVNH